MARKLLPQEFYKELSKKLNCNVDRAQFIWENTVEFFVDEMKMYGSVMCPSFGEFKSVTQGGKNIHIPNSKQDKIRLGTEDKLRIEYVDFYQQIKFFPAESLKQVMNGKIDTTSVWKRVREEIKKKEMEDAQLKEQEAVLERKRNAMNMVRAIKDEKIKKRKNFEKLSKKKQQDIMDDQNKNKDWEE